MKSFLDPAVNVDVSRISCKLCPDKTKDLNSLVNHLIETHGIAFNKSIGICMSPYVLNDISVSCAICQGVYQTFGRLLFHTNKYHSNPLDVLCDFCGSHFTTNQRLKEHINNKHDHKTVKCRLCDDKIVPSKIRTHMQRVHGKKYKCSSCTEVFETHYKRTAHMMNVHKNRAKVKCPQCPLEFVFQSAMMTHVRRSHMLEKNAVCGVCGWQCFESSRLQTHMMKHSNERPFVCSDCGKAFKTKKGLKRHCETLHLAVKPNLRPPKLSS